MKVPEKGSENGDGHWQVVHFRRNMKVLEKGVLKWEWSICKGFKTLKRLKEHFLISRNRTKRANFQCNHLSQATYNTTENS